MDETQTLFRIAELERKVAHLYRQLGVAEPQQDEGAVVVEVQQALAAGNTIQAIKIEREQTGMDLASAKRVVDGLIGQPRIIQ